jgi:hypothetical protein
MSATISITQVHFKNNVTPAGPVVATVKWKLGAAPDVDGSYTTVTTNQAIATDGTLPSVLNITGLDYNTVYTIFVKPNNCGIGVKKNFTTDPPSCVDVDDMTATISG